MMMPDPMASWAGLRVLVLTPTPTWPINLGNRNRIFHINRALQKAGAVVEVLHYPGDDAGSDSVSPEMMRHMAAQWDGYFIAPVTRPLHTPPRFSADHQIDEWWDPAIGDVLTWLFRNRHYDAFIVNYTWLSKALDYAPRTTCRILDTHDQFSGRRDLLKAQGINREFFHLTPKEEAQGLDRADLIWAIKPQEAAFFETLTKKPVLTMGHHEATRPVKRPASLADGILRLGLVGGQNNTNRVNFRNFLLVAESYLKQTLLPVEILLAGSICDCLDTSPYPWVRRLGRLEDMDQLYEQVDAVLAPMSFSTGLKIKIGEALAAGLPIISHAHAFEGYPATHAFHQCANFAAMMMAAHQILREPNLLGPLAEASAKAQHQNALAVAHALSTTRDRINVLPPSMIYVLRSEHLAQGHLIGAHMLHAANAYQDGPVAFHLAGDAALATPDMLQQCATLGPLIAKPEDVAGLQKALGTGPFPAPRAGTLADVLAAPHHGAWFAYVPQDLPQDGLRTRCGIAHRSILALDGAGGDTAQQQRLAQSFPRFLVLEATPTEGSAALARRPQIQRLTISCLRHERALALLRALRQAPRHADAAIIAPWPEAPDLPPLLVFLTEILGRPVRLFGGLGAGSPASYGPFSLRQDLLESHALDQAFEPARWQGRKPSMVIEVTRPGATAPFREIALRAHVPHLHLAHGATSPVAAHAKLGSQRVTGLISAAMAIQAIYRRPHLAAEQAAALAEAEFGHEAGWSALWREIRNAA